MMPMIRHARALAGAVLLSFQVGSPATAQPARPKAEEVAKLRAKVEELLTSELTNHWYPRALDRDLGGFHQGFARDWSPRPDTDRFLVYQARMTWTAAAFARFAPEHRDEYAGYARYGVAYIDATMRDADHGGFHFVLDPHGKVDAKLGDEKHIYGTAFVLYAASAARAATGDERALKVARDAFDWLERHAHDTEHGGYFEAITRDGKPILSYDPNAPAWRRTDRLGVYYGFKSMNSHIHLLEALAAFSKVERTPIVAERLRETLAIVRDKVAVEPGALNLYLTRDWRAAPAHDSFGHDVETAYLLVEAAEALGVPDDARTRRVARSLVDHALDFGWDGEHGGFFDKGDVFAGRPYDTTKVWWTQAEGLNALLLMHTLYGETTDRYWAAFLKQWDFIARHQLDPDHGGWFGDVTREGKPLGDGAKATPWKANYHTSRALMNVATMLRRLETAAPPDRKDR
ncbi:MAG TPA: AGE family epimerase/isomerase [Isosphaeraceae bacterium]|jgi:mannobiose 2-epimerase|nr:AGE family epimerase/isomerase [Isosphaeraceae bacterium]